MRVTVPQRLQLVRLRVDVGLDDVVAQRGIVAEVPAAASRSSEISSRRVARNRPGLRSVSPRSEPVVAIATRHPSLHLTEHEVVGHEHVVEEHLGEPLVAVEPAEAAHGDAGRVERDEEVGQAVVALGVGVGAEQAEEVGAERAAGGPGLLPAEPPAPGDRRRAPPWP